MADIIDFAQRRNATPEMEAGLNKPKKTEDIEVLDVIRLLVLALKKDFHDPTGEIALLCWEAIWDELNPFAEDGHGPMPVEVPPELREAIGKMNRAAFFKWLEGQ